MLRGFFVIRQNLNKCHKKYPYSFKFMFYIDFSQIVCIIKYKEKCFCSHAAFFPDGGNSFRNKEFWLFPPYEREHEDVMIMKTASLA